MFIIRKVLETYDCKTQVIQLIWKTIRTYCDSVGHIMKVFV